MSAALNRRERRPRKAQFRREMLRMAERAAGLWAIEIARPNSRTAAQWRKALDDVKEPPLCLFCDFELTRSSPPQAFALLRPGRSDPSTVVLMGFCEEHARAPDLALLYATFEVLRNKLITDLRRLDPAMMMSSGGRA